MSEVYEEWAEELMQCLLEEWNEPLSEYNYGKAIKKLAKKLKTDMTDSIVPEQFCSDCDYVRRYER